METGACFVIWSAARGGICFRFNLGRLISAWELDTLKTSHSWERDVTPNMMVNQMNSTLFFSCQNRSHKDHWEEDHAGGSFESCSTNFGSLEYYLSSLNLDFKRRHQTDFNRLWKANVNCQNLMQQQIKYSKWDMRASLLASEQ